MSERVGTQDRWMSGVIRSLDAGSSGEIDRWKEYPPQKRDRSPGRSMEGVCLDLSW